MQEIHCNFCGSSNTEQRRIDYLYSHQGKYLLVPNTPVEICADYERVEGKLLAEEVI